ncbi:MAG: maleylpyruvate isomerase N-terminal domain-containing protein [Anaerolineaceae bacterium]
MQSPQPVIAAPLFLEIHQELISLLKSLSADDWQKPTVCSGWSVKDVTLHILGGEIGNISRRRDGCHADVSINRWEELVVFVNDWNQSWVSAARRMSPRLIIDLLELAGRQMCAYFLEMDPFSIGGPVDWVGPEPAPAWLDLAREYTERWHHQQQIRDAVDRPGLKQPKYYYPVLDAFIRALPRTFEAVNSAENTSVSVSITGDAGGRWSVLRENGAWNLYTGVPENPTAELIVDQDIAWRLFTRGIDQDTALKQVTFKGDQTLARKVMDMISIIR